MKKTATLLLSLMIFSSLGFAHWLGNSVPHTPTLERTIKNTIPEHVPVQIVAVRNLQQDEWWRDFELEVKNTGDKPIYFFIVYLTYSDVFRPGTHSHIGVSLMYGRHEMIEFKNMATPNDAPINPGESCILKIPADSWAGLKHQNSRTDVPAAAFNKLELMFVSLNFGDGTGLGTTKGLPAGKIRNHQNHASSVSKSYRSKATRNKKNHSATKRSQLGCECQCSLQKLLDDNGCYCFQTSQAISAFCVDPDAECSEPDFVSRECYVGPDPDNYFYCEDWFLLPCF
jgi:hypothetical protein